MKMYVKYSELCGYGYQSYAQQFKGKGRSGRRFNCSVDIRKKLKYIFSGSYTPQILELII